MRVSPQVLMPVAVACLLPAVCCADSPDPGGVWVGRWVQRNPTSGGHFLMTLRVEDEKACGVFEWTWVGGLRGHAVTVFEGTRDAETGVAQVRERAVGEKTNTHVVESVYTIRCAATDSRFAVADIASSGPTGVVYFCRVGSLPPEQDLRGIWEGADKDERFAAVMTLSMTDQGLTGSGALLDLASARLTPAQVSAEAADEEGSTWDVAWAATNGPTHRLRGELDASRCLLVVSPAGGAGGAPWLLVRRAGALPTRPAVP